MGLHRAVGECADDHRDHRVGSGLSTLRIVSLETKMNYGEWQFLIAFVLVVLVPFGGVVILTRKRG
jgi:hypothetical protein